jgi:hypothetical protein
MTFTAPVFISIGDEFEKKAAPGSDRFKGKSFMTSPGKRGAGADTLFSKKFLSLAEGDKYVDPGYFDKRYKLGSEKQKLTPQGFKYTSASKQPAGLGSYFGCFCENAPPKHEVEYVVTKRGEMPDKAKPHQRNMVTSPAKRGTYGVPNVTLSHGDEFKYVSDPYEGEKRKEALQAKESSKRVVGPAFKGACKRGGFFDETSHGVSKVYSITKALPAKKSADGDVNTMMGMAWKPAGSLVGHQVRVPEYMEDPYEAKERSQREQRDKNKPTTVWKPISNSKSMPSKSIKFTPS